MVEVIFSYIGAFALGVIGGLVVPFVVGKALYEVTKRR